MKISNDWKERLFKGIIEAVIAFITAFTVASCAVAMEPQRGSICQPRVSGMPIGMTKTLGTRNPNTFFVAPCQGAIMWVGC